MHEVRMLQGVVYDEADEPDSRCRCWAIQELGRQNKIRGVTAAGAGKDFCDLNGDLSERQ